MEMCPAAKLAMSMGIKKGLTRRGPLSRRAE